MRVSWSGLQRPNAIKQLNETCHANLRVFILFWILAGGRYRLLDNDATLTKIVNARYRCLLNSLKDQLCSLKTQVLALL